MIICSGCGKLIDNHFFYCPWCGVSRLEKDTKEAEDLRIEQYSLFQKEKREQQVMNMARELDDLEEELSVLVLSAEMHK